MEKYEKVKAEEEQLRSGKKKKQKGTMADAVNETEAIR